MQLCLISVFFLISQIYYISDLRTLVIVSQLAQSCLFFSHMMVLKPSRQLKSYFWKLVNSTSYAIMLFNVYDLMTPQFFCPYIKLTAHGAQPRHCKVTTPRRATHSRFPCCDARRCWFRSNAKVLKLEKRNLGSDLLLYMGPCIPAVAAAVSLSCLLLWQFGSGAT